mgnify:FL=1|jgi:hypothetical protein
MTGASSFAVRISVLCLRARSEVTDIARVLSAHSLKPIFYGLAYTPFNALEPWCGANLNNVTEDILLMSQMTSTLSPLPEGTDPVTRPG